MRILEISEKKSIPVWTDEIQYNLYAFWENNESGIRSRHVSVWRGLSIVLSVINSGPNNYYGIDRIPVCTGSGMYRLYVYELASIHVSRK